MDREKQQAFPPEDEAKEERIVFCMTKLSEVRLIHHVPVIPNLVSKCNSRSRKVFTKLRDWELGDLLDAMGVVYFSLSFPKGTIV